MVIHKIVRVYRDTCWYRILCRIYCGVGTSGVCPEGCILLEGIERRGCGLG